MIECILPLKDSPIAETQELQQICREVCSLEEIIQAIMSHYLACRISAIPEESGRILAIEVITANSWTSKPAASGIICIPEAQLANYKFKAIPTNVRKDPISKEYKFDTKWFEKRDKRLRVRYDRWLNDYLVAPASLSELILSYAFSPRGTVDIKRELGHINAGVKDLLEMTFTYLPPQPDLTMQEVLYMQLDKLEQLLEKRKAKRELNQGAVVN